MAHNLTQRENGKYEFCFTGSRKAIWHGLGQELTQDASIDQWKTEAGMDWEVFPSVVQYTTMEGNKFFDDKRVLFRSDTKAPLSVVSSEYNIVQPGEVLEFFRDLTTLHGYKLSAAGTILGGKRFWATADIGKTTNANDGDTVNGQLLLVTSVDGTLATQARMVSTRVVCQNTMTVALGENTKSAVKVSHKSEWDATKVKLDMGLIDASWNTFSENIKKLAQVNLTDSDVKGYLQTKFYNPEKTAEDQTTAAIKRVNTLMGLYSNGTGAEMGRGTAWNLLNAVTEMYTHGTRASQDPSIKFLKNTFGSGDDVKTDVYNDMLALCI